MNEVAGTGLGTPVSGCRIRSADFGQGGRSLRGSFEHMKAKRIGPDSCEPPGPEGYWGMFA